MSLRPFQFLLPLCLVAILGACSDALTEAVQGDDRPFRLALEHDSASAVEGDTLRLTFTVLNSRGEPVDLPEWALPRWSTDPEQLVESDQGVALATASGEGLLTLRLAGLEDALRVRIHPSILRVDMEQAYLVQTVQRLDGSVPLVAGKDAALRVFARADRANFWVPQASLTLYQEGAAVDSRSAELHGRFIPEAIDDHHISGSWLFDVPGEHIRPGMRFRVDLIDQDAPQPIMDGSVLTVSRGYDSGEIDIREVDPFRVRFIPIFQEAFGTLADVTPENAEDYVTFARSVWPLHEIDIDVRAPFSSSAVSDDGSSTDTSILLREMRALRTDDGDRRYYYGVYRHHGSAGAGRGYVGFPVSVGFDRLTPRAGDWVLRAASTFAHEIGHNFGRRHAPACNAPNADDAFPHEEGRSGVAGFDPEHWAFRSPEIGDLMGYCRPRWISDYTYEAAITFREMFDDEGGSTRWVDEGDGLADEDVLIVWGSVGSEGTIIEPAFRSRTRPQRPSGTGPYRLVGMSEEGAILFDHRFEGAKVAHSEGAQYDFAFALPLADFDGDRLHGLRLFGPGTDVRRTSTFSSVSVRTQAMTGIGRTADPLVTASGAGLPGGALVWDGDRYPLAVIRAPGTGEVVGFGRDGRYSGPLPAGEVTVVLSDGVISVEEGVRVR